MRFNDTRDVRVVQSYDLKRLLQVKLYYIMAKIIEGLKWITTFLLHAK